MAVPPRPIVQVGLHAAARLVHDGAGTVAASYGTAAAGHTGGRSSHDVVPILPALLSLVQRNEVCMRAELAAGRGAHAFQMPSSAAAIAEELDCSLVICIEDIGGLAAFALAAESNCGNFTWREESPVGCCDGASAARELVAGISKVGESMTRRSGPWHVSVVGQISTIMSRKWGLPPHLPHGVMSHEALFEGLCGRSLSTGLGISCLETRQPVANSRAPERAVVRLDGREVPMVRRRGVLERARPYWRLVLSERSF